ncbi:MAG: hypothetical protein ABH883_09090, partial [Candidatus Omnitrophota bacterium]
GGKMKKIAVMVMVLLAVCFVMQSYQSNAAEITKKQMIENAEKALEAGGITLDGVNIIYDDGNTFWQERVAYLEKDAAQNHGILPHGVLRNKDYQVVYFDFVESSPLGDTWVFLDPATGDVIGVYEEK